MIGAKPRRSLLRDVGVEENMKRFVTIALCSILVLSSLAAAASTFTISHIKFRAMSAVQSFEQAGSLHNLSLTDSIETQWAEAKEHMTRAMRWSDWLRAHESLLMNAFFIGSLCSAVTGLALMIPILFSLRRRPLTAAQQKYLASAALGIFIACLSYIFWVSESRGILAASSQLNEQLQEIETASDQALIEMTTVTKQLQDSAAHQNYALLCFGIGACLWPMGIVPLVAMKNKQTRRLRNG